MGCLGPLFMIAGISVALINRGDDGRCIALILIFIGIFLQWNNYSRTVHHIPGVDSNGNSDDSSDHDQEDSVDPF